MAYCAKRHSKQESNQFIKKRNRETTTTTAKHINFKNTKFTHERKTERMWTQWNDSKVVDRTAAASKSDNNKPCSFVYTLEWKNVDQQRRREWKYYREPEHIKSSLSLILFRLFWVQIHSNRRIRFAQIFFVAMQ